MSASDESREMNTYLDDLDRMYAEDRARHGDRINVPDVRRRRTCRWCPFFCPDEAQARAYVAALAEGPRTGTG